MKTKTKIDYNERLLLLANYAKKIEYNPKMLEYGMVHLCLFNDKGQTDYNVRYPHWLFDELPQIFEEWYYSRQSGLPLLKGLGCHEDTCSGIFDFFDLSPFEFIHLFSLDGNQNTAKYGGQILDFTSSGEAIANNIFAFVKRRMPSFDVNYSLN